MLERFVGCCRAHEGRVGEIPSTGSPLSRIAGALGGCSFYSGLYRVFTPAESANRTALATAAFPRLAGRIQCFGMDWLGRQFATDSGRGTVEDPEVLLLEPGSGAALEIPVPLSAFHDEELLDFADAALAVEFYRDWLTSGGDEPGRDQCVGYRTPVFLGGAEQVNNLELRDVDAYWRQAALLLAERSAVPV